jgi:hypothetical protein
LGLSYYLITLSISALGQGIKNSITLCLCELTDDVEPGLLRAQSAAAFLSPRDHADKSRTAQSPESPRSPGDEDCEQWLPR